jgi:pyruvate formate lyase activating enzyme
MTRLPLLGLLLGALTAQPPARADWRPVQEAGWYHRLAGKRVGCDLCPHRCVIAPGKRGACRVRQNSNGTLYSLVYGRPCSVGKEPIEKSPFFHFLPGTRRLTLATAGCNQQCRYCQNWELSQARPEDLPARDLPPDSVVALARREGVPTICLTYTEPVVFYEYVRDIAVRARAAGLRTAVVTGGFVNPEPLAELCRLVDAIKIDLKGFTPEFYRTVCGSELEPVKAAIRTVAASGTHLEIVNLVVPAHNDDTGDIRRMCRWLVENAGDTVPVHFTRFSPDYRLRNSPATPVATLERAVAIARAEGLKYVYIGNVPGHADESTRCPQCGRTLIARAGYTVTGNYVKSGRCPQCGTAIAGVWQ